MVAFYLIIEKLSYLSRCWERNIVEWFSSSKINLVVTCTSNWTCHHVTNSRKKLKFPGELRYSKQIWEFTNRKCCSICTLKVFFFLEQRKIFTSLYVPLTGHLTIWHILSARSEPQDMLIAIQVIARKLPCLRCCYEGNIVEWVNSSKLTFRWHVSLIVLGTTLQIRERNWNFRLS